jgi:hypothetical protein
LSALARQTWSPDVGLDWQPEVLQLLDEHHLVACSERMRLRLDFGASLGRFLAAQGDTEVCHLQGRHIRCLDSLCDQFERQLPGPPLQRRIDGPAGLTALLRMREPSGPSRPSRWRFYVWHDAETLLRSDRVLFGRVVEALAGVAAESEYASDDLLLIQRCVLLGGDALSRYARDAHGQCRSWIRDDFDEPFWRVVTGVEAPRFKRLSIDALSRYLG